MFPTRNPQDKVTTPTDEPVLTDEPAFPSRVQYILDLQPARLEIHDISKEEFISILEQLDVPLLSDHADKIFDEIKRGVRPELQNILVEFDPKVDFFVRASSRWTTEGGKLREVVACELSLCDFDADDSEVDLDISQLTLTICRDLRRPTVSLEIMYDEELLFLNGERPDRLATFEIILSLVGIFIPPGTTIPEGRNRLTLCPEASIEFNGPELNSISWIKELHPALRPEILVHVLGANSSEDDVLCRAHQMLAHIATTVVSYDVIDSKGDLDAAWDEAARSTKRNEILFIQHEDLVLPFFRRSTLENLKSDVKTLLEMREAIFRARPNHELVLPTEVRASVATIQETEDILKVSDCSIPSEVLTNMYSHLLYLENFDATILNLLDGSTPPITLRFTESAFFSQAEPPGLWTHFSIEPENPVQPQVSIFGFDKAAVECTETVKEKPAPATEETWDTGCDYEDERSGYCDVLPDLTRADSVTVLVNWPKDVHHVDAKVSSPRWSFVKDIALCLQEEISAGCYDYFGPTKSPPHTKKGDPRIQITTRKLAPPSPATPTLS